MATMQDQLAGKIEMYYKKSLDLIEEHRFFFITQVVAYLPIVKKTFYHYFPTDSPEYEEIRRRLDFNKASASALMQKNWVTSDNATLQIALMRMIVDDEQFERLIGYRKDEKELNNVKIVIKDGIITQE